MTSKLWLSRTVVGAALIVASGRARSAPSLGAMLIVTLLGVPSVYFSLGCRVRTTVSVSSRKSSFSISTRKLKVVVVRPPSRAKPLSESV